MHDEVLEPERNVVLPVYEIVKVSLRADESLEERDEGREESARSQRAECGFEKCFRRTVDSIISFRCCEMRENNTDSLKKTLRRRRIGGMTCRAA